MATMLLIGTNAWATLDDEWLQTQFDAVQPGQTATITLDDDVILDAPVYLGTKNITDLPKSITLNMNGHYMQMNGTTSKWNFMFILAHGELFVTNSKKDTQTSEIKLVGQTKAGNANSSIFSVYGSYKSSRWLEDGSALQTDSTKIINTRVFVGFCFCLVKYPAVHACAVVIFSPYAVAVFIQFLPIFLCRHTPFAAPVGRCGIVGRIKRFLAIAKELPRVAVPFEPRPSAVVFVGNLIFIYEYVIFEFVYIFLFQNFFPAR